jgi:excisionase family DNA binding protein
MREQQAALMTVREVATYLRVHPMTVYRLIQRGELPAIRVGRGWRFSRSRIEQWLRAHANRTR